ncbi:MAG: patatin-like phospholipase family protein [Planctomycetes bacterium]|nr:patatin-like phospholipase family protein [Planctomycetota bacterium]
MVSENSKKPPRVRLGLALSGGGFRASFYHLGAIRYLEEAGIMPKIEVMSTVSGGSIVGAYYLVQMEKKLRATPDCDRLKACDEIIREFIEAVNHNLRMQALIFHPFYHPFQFFLRLVFKQHPGDTMARAFERRLYRPALRIGDLPVQVVDEDNSVSGTKLLINTTSLVSGKRVVFARESDTGLRAQLYKSDPNNIPLARAVGASAAVPGVFRPLRIGKEVLSDGGVVDNQGIESLLDYFEISAPEANLLPYAFRQPAKLRRQVREETKREEDPERNGALPDDKVFLIVSDGAGQFHEQAVVKTTRANSAMRATSILQAGSRRKVLKLLLGLDEDNDYFEGFAFTHLAQNIKGQPKVDNSNRLPSEFIGPVSEIRTDLDDFSRIERDALIFHGYTLMKYRIEKHAYHLIEKPPMKERTKEKAPEEENSRGQRLFSWPPPFMILCIPKQGCVQRAAVAREKIQFFLSVGKQLLFRDFCRFKFAFGPVLLLFVLLAAILSKLALHGNLSFAGQAAHETATFHSKLGDYFEKAVLGLMPKITPGYSIIEEALGEGGWLWGTVQFLAGLFCVAISIYFSLWLYWEFKRRIDLPQRMEKRMLEQIGSISDE